MAIEFNTDFKNKIDEVIVNACTIVATHYFVTKQINDFPFVDLTAEYGKKILNEVMERLDEEVKKGFGEQADDKLLKIISDLMRMGLTTTYRGLGYLTDVVRHDHGYLLRILNEEAQSFLISTGIWNLEATSDEKQYLDSFVYLIKFRYTQPLRYDDYISKNDTIRRLLDLFNKFIENRGAIIFVDELNKVVDVNKLLTTFQ